MVISVIAMLAMSSQTAEPGVRTVDLRDGYMRLETPSYSVDIPKGWSFSTETPWGARKANPEGSSGELGLMTAGPSRASWDDLYRTSLFFIMREEQGTATPYRLIKHESGLEAAEFGVKNESGFIHRRYVLVKHPGEGVAGAERRIPNERAEREWDRHFRRMVASAQFR